MMLQYIQADSAAEQIMVAKKPIRHFSQAGFCSIIFINTCQDLIDFTRYACTGSVIPFSFKGGVGSTVILS